jgi:hypothetical protein
VPVVDIKGQSGIYQIRNLLNGKVYVGSAKCLSTRWRFHRNSLRRKDHHSRKLQNSWNKYSAEAFIFEPLLLCSVDDLLFYEQRAIDCLSAASKGYNMRASADIANRGANSAEHNARISAAHTGMKYDDAHCKKLSTIQLRLRRGVRVVYKGKSNTLRGWADELGLTYNVLQHRLRQWGSIDAVVEGEALPRAEVLAAGRKVRLKNAAQLTVAGVTKRVSEWAAEVGMSSRGLYNRMQQGWSDEDVVLTPRHKRPLKWQI